MTEGWTMKKNLATTTALALALSWGLPTLLHAEDEAPADAPAEEEAPVPVETTAAPSQPEPEPEAAAPEPAPAPAGEPMYTPEDMQPAAPATKPAAKKRSGPAPKALRAARLLAEGRAAERAREHSRAIALYEKAVKAAPSSADAFFHLGNAYYARAYAVGTGDRADKDDSQAAADAYQTALALDPKAKSIRDPFTLYHSLAQSLETVGEYRKALEALKGASKHNPENPMPHLYGARIRLKMQDPERATANLYWSIKRARKLNMYPQLARMIKADPRFSGLMGIPQGRVIVDSFDAVQSGALTEDAAVERIRLAGEREGLRDAVSDRPTSRTSRPASMDTPVTDPVVLQRIDDGHRAFEAGDFRQAVTDYQNALTADGPKGTMDAVMRSMVLERLGASYRHMGHAGEGIRVLTRSVETLPENSSAHYELALCFAAGGQPGAALSALNRALDTAGTLAQLRKTLLLSKTDPELASVRDIPRYKLIIDSHERKVARR